MHVSDQLLTVCGSVVNTEIKFLLDSGASHNFVSKGLCLQLGLEMCQHKFGAVSVKLADGKTVR